MHSGDIVDVLPSKNNSACPHTPKRSRNIEPSSSMSNNDNASVTSKRMLDSLPCKKNNASTRPTKRSCNVVTSSPLPNNDYESVSPKRNHSKVGLYTYPVSKKQRTPEKWNWWVYYKKVRI